MQRVLNVTVGTGYNARDEFAVRVEKPPLQPWTILKHYSPALCLFQDLDADDIGNMTIPELLHHALLDARLLAGLYHELAPALRQ